jgi:D-xylose transport system substrate-binding protein
MIMPSRPAWTGFRGRKLTRLLLFSCTFAILMFAACSDPEPPRDGTPGREVVIGFSLDSLVVERWQRDEREFVEMARSLGAEVEYRNALADPTRQIEDVLELIDMGVDALVIVPNDAEALAPAIQRARDQDIPVVSYDRLILGADISAYVSFDNVEVGRLMAEGMLKFNDNAGRFLIINGGSVDNNSRLLKRGIMEVLQPYIDRGSVEIVGEISPRDWYSSLIEEELESYIRNGGIDGIIAANDLFADTAIQLLARYRQAGNVIVVGQDADLIAVQRLVEGIQHRTIYKPIDQLAKAAAETAYHLALGESIRSTRPVNNGATEVPSILIPPVAVEKENIDSTVIADGFHRREDVYRGGAGD